MLSNEIKQLHKLSIYVELHIKVLSKTQKISILQNFLNECVSIPEISSSNLFKQFIGSFETKSLKLKTPNTRPEQQQSTQRFLGHARTKSALYLNPMQQSNTLSANQSKLEKTQIQNKKSSQLHNEQVKSAKTKAPTPSMINNMESCPSQQQLNSNNDTRSMKNLLVMSKSGNNANNNTLLTQSRSGMINSLSNNHTNTNSTAQTQSAKKSTGQSVISKIKNQKQSFAQKRSFVQTATQNQQQKSARKGSSKKRQSQAPQNTELQTVSELLFNTLETPRELAQYQPLTQRSQAIVTPAQQIDSLQQNRINPHDIKCLNQVQSARTKSQTTQNNLENLLIEEQKILEQKRKKSQEPKLNESDELELLSYNEYMANAKIARKLKQNVISGASRGQSPLDFRTQFMKGISTKSLPTQIGQNAKSSTQNPTMTIASHQNTQIHNQAKINSLVTNLIQKTIGAKRLQAKQASESPQSQRNQQLNNYGSDQQFDTDEFSKRFNPTVLMKNQSMKEHFKKQRRQNIYENLINDQQNLQINLNSDSDDDIKHNRLIYTGNTNTGVQSVLGTRSKMNLQISRKSGSNESKHLQRQYGVGIGIVGKGPSFTHLNKHLSSNVQRPNVNGNFGVQSARNRLYSNNINNI
eukprot:403341357